MPDSKDCLIETAVRPFIDDAELQHSAAEFLRRNAHSDARQEEAMAARWEKVDARKRTALHGIWLWVALGVVSVAGIAADFDDGRRWMELLRGSFGSYWFIYSPPSDSEARVAAKLDSRQNFLLFGDRTKSRKHERKEALWRSDPDNPGFYQEYAAAYLWERKKLPPDFLATARRIDPDNAWFTYMAAGLEAKGAVKRQPRQSKKIAGKTIRDAQTWEILDPARMERALALIREARNQPNHEDHRIALMGERWPLLSQATPLDHFDSIVAAEAISTFQGTPSMSVADVMAAQAWSFGISGDGEGLRELIRDGDRLLHGICSDQHGTLIEGMTASWAVTQLSDSFANASEKLGLADESMRWKTTDALMTERSQARKKWKFMVDGKSLESEMVEGGMVGSMGLVARHAEHQPPLTDADLKPGRWMNHEIVSRLLGHVLWLVMAVVLAFTAAHRFRVSRMSRRLAGRASCLLDRVDKAWILVLGVLLPFAYVMAINRLTPLGGRQFSLVGTAFLLPAMHFVGLWILWLVAVPQIVRWRLAKRAGGLGFSKPPWAGWVAIVCAAAFIPLIGWVGIRHSYPEFWTEWMKTVPFNIEPASKTPPIAWAALGLMGLTFVWLMRVILVALLGDARRLVYRAATAMVLVRVWAVVLLVLALATTGFRISENYWFQKDKLAKLDPEGPGLSRYENQVAAQVRKELREILGYQ